MSESHSASTTPLSSMVTEKQENVLLGATRPPSGSLQMIPECTEMNGILVPEQAYLVRIRLAPYLQLRKLRSEARGSTTYTIFGHDDEQLFAMPAGTATTGSTSPSRTPQQLSRATSEHALTSRPSSSVLADTVLAQTVHREGARYETHLSLEQYDAINEVLCEFVRHHLLAFRRSSGTSFTTASGQHGEFSDMLDTVTVTSAQRLTSARVLGDLDAVNPLGNFMERTRHVCCPASLPIFLVSRALLPDDELQALLVRLHSAVRDTQSRVTWSTPTVNTPATSSEPMVVAATAGPAGRYVDPPREESDAVPHTAYAPSTHATSDLGLFDLPTNPTASTAVPTPRQVDPATFSRSLRSEDLENDVTVEIDLTPFESKVEERQRRSLLTARSTAPTETTGPPSSAALGTPERALLSGAKATATTTGAVVRDARGTLAGVVKGTPVLGPSPQPKPVTADGASAAAQAPRVLQHEYSRESITNYRKVVAADNEIHYREFQLLMEQPLSMPLAELLSLFVSEMQQQEYVFYDNKPVIKLRSRWAARLASIPLLAGSERKSRILTEGMEKYISCKLYFRMFNVRPDEARDNTVLQEKWEQLVTMPAALLDALPEVEKHHVWGQAMFELDGMNFFKTPREKLRCGMRACELLSLAVGDILEKRRRVTAPATTGAGARREAPLAFGADEFLPCFMLLVLRAQPYNYCQNVRFIDLFRSPDLMSPEENYCLANLLSATDFWLRCDRNGQILSTRRTSPNPAAAASNGKVAPRGSGRAAVAHVSAPVLSEDDLLPSVKNSRHAALRANSAEPAANAAATAATTTTTPAATATAAPNVLDTLFNWVNTVTHPTPSNVPVPTVILDTPSAPVTVASQASLDVPSASLAASLPTNGTFMADGTRVSSPLSFMERWRRGSSAPDQAPTASSAPPANSLMLGSGGSSAEFAPMPLAGVPVSSQNSASKVRQLLVTQNKPFEALSVSELQLIVEEMRKRLQDGSSSR